MTVDRGPFDPEVFRAEGHRLVDQLADYLARATRGEGVPVLAATPPEAMLARWPGDFGEEPGADLGALVARLVDDSTHLHHPRYVGYQISPTLPVAALADLAASLLNNGMAAYEGGPAATAMEARVVAWMASALGLPAGADGVLTSGGSLGNLTALLAARQVRAGFDVWREGAGGGPPLAILAAETAHYSVARAAQIMGLGEGGVVDVPVDGRFRMRAEGIAAAADRAAQAGRRAIAVVASAGSTATGSFDSLDAIADACAERGLWLHVDGAHGASAALSPRYRHLLRGIERADSVVWDAHKMLAMPALATAVLFRDGGASWETFAQRAAYLFDAKSDGRGQWYHRGLRTIECTKRMLSVPVYAPLSVLGTRALAEHVERTFDVAARFGELLDAAPDFELATRPECNILCFRFVPEGAGDLDALQERVQKALVAGGRFFVAKTTLGGRGYLRTSIMSSLTSEADLVALMEAIRALRQVPRSSSAGYERSQ